MAAIAGSNPSALKKNDAMYQIDIIHLGSKFVFYSVCPTTNIFLMSIRGFGRVEIWYNPNECVKTSITFLSYAKFSHVVKRELCSKVSSMYIST